MFPVVQVEAKSLHPNNSVRASDAIFNGEPPSAEDLKPKDFGLREILAAVYEDRQGFARVFVVGR